MKKIITLLIIMTAMPITQAWAQETVAIKTETAAPVKTEEAVVEEPLFKEEPAAVKAVKTEKPAKTAKPVKVAEPAKTETHVKVEEPAAAAVEEAAKAEETPIKEGDVFNANAMVEGSVATNKLISVDDCIKIALENNPTILSQMMSKDIYKNKIAQAWSNYFPTFNAGISYSKNDMLMTNFTFPMQTYNLYNVPSLGFNQLIFDFGKTRAQAGIAKKTYEASVDTAQANINDVVYQVKSAYYNLLYAQQAAEVYEDSVLQYQIHMKQAQAYYDIGSKAKIDVMTAAYNLDNTKLSLITAKNTIDNGFAQLTSAMGVPEFGDFSIKDRLDKKKYNVVFDDALKTAYESRPELLAAQKKAEASKILIQSSKMAFLPNLNAMGNYTSGGSRPGKDYGYQIGGQLAYSNINFYLMKKQMDESKLTHKKDQADSETQRQRVYLDVKQAYIQLKNSQESIPVARSSMNMAKEQYDLASGRYKVGLGDAIELKDAENTYRNSKLQYYNSLMQYHINAANLERVIGAPLTATEENL